MQISVKGRSEKKETYHSPLDPAGSSTLTRRLGDFDSPSLARRPLLGLGLTSPERERFRLLGPASANPVIIGGGDVGSGSGSGTGSTGVDDLEDLVCILDMRG